MSPCSFSSPLAMSESATATRLSMLPLETSLRRECNRGLGTCGVPTGKEADRVDGQERARNGQEQFERREQRGRRYPEAIRNEAPREPAEQHADRDAEQQASGCQGHSLPPDRRAHLGPDEAERLEHRELPSPAAHRGDKRVSDRD